MLWLTKDAVLILLGNSFIGYVGPGMDQLRSTFLAAFDTAETEERSHV